MLDAVGRLYARASSAWRRRYASLGCVGYATFVAGLILGLFGSLWVCEAVTITIMRPPGGFFVDGLRYAEVPDRYHLTNGEPVPMALRLLTPALYLLLMFAWQFALVFLITSASRVVAARRVYGRG